MSHFIFRKVIIDFRYMELFFSQVIYRCTTFCTKRYSLINRSGYMKYMIVRQHQSVCLRKEIRRYSVFHIVDTQTFFRCYKKSITPRLNVSNSRIYNSIRMIILLKIIAIKRIQTSFGSEPHHTIVILSYSCYYIRTEITV